MATDVREPLAFQTATGHVAQFHRQYELVNSEQFESMDRSECEAFLQLGIESFRWLLRADYSIRQGIYNDSIEYDSNTDRTLEQLFRDWLIPAKWANSQSERGNAISNAEEFRRCYAEAREIVEAFDENDTRAMSEQLTQLRDRAIYEQQHGETAEFF